MRRAPRGFYAFCGSVTAAAGVVIAANLLHHPGGALPQASGPRGGAPGVSSPAAPVARVSLPAVVPGSGPATGASPVVGSSVQAPGARSPAASPTGGSVGSGRSPAPHPSPAGRGDGPAVVVSVSAGVQLRGATLPVRVVLAVPGAPPFPTVGGLLLP